MGNQPDADETLAELLSALASQERMVLLRQLGVPKTLSELRLRGMGCGRWVTPADRPYARQTVRHHLDRLVSVGIVRQETVERGHRRTRSYVADAARLASLSARVSDLLRSRVKWAAIGPRQIGTPAGSDAVLPA